MKQGMSIVGIIFLGAALAQAAVAGPVAQKHPKPPVTIQPLVMLPPRIDVKFTPVSPSNRDRVVFTAIPNNPAVVSRVDFWLDARKIGESSSSPWTLEAGPYAAGEHTIGVVSYDAGGRQWAKKYAHLRIRESSLDLTFEFSPAQPTNRDQVTVRAVMPVQPDIHSLVFYVNARKVAEDRAYPWEFTGGPFPARMHAIGAEAYDNAGNPIGRKYSALRVIFFPVELTLNHSPAQPTSADKITFMAGASDRRDIVKVEFFVNARSIGIDKVHPWRVTAGPFPQGRITYGVVIYDREGRSQKSMYKGLRIN